MKTFFQSATKSMADFGKIFGGQVAVDPEPPKPKTPWYRRVAERYVQFLNTWSPWRLRAHLSEQLDFNVRTLAQLKEVEEFMLEMRSERDAAIMERDTAISQNHELQKTHRDLMNAIFSENGKLDEICRKFTATKKMIDKIVEEHRPFKKHVAEDEILK